MNTFKRRIFRLLKAWILKDEMLLSLREESLWFHSKNLQQNRKNPFNKFGRRVFSQTDEDGITIEIIRRLGLIHDQDSLEKPTYAELGVGDGTENNTLVLASLGWKGFWVDSQALLTKHSSSPRWKFYQSWITRDNVVDLVKTGMTELGADQLDLLSIDIDGIDLIIARKILASGVKPKIVIVEFNTKFAPPIKFEIKYNPSHTWAHNDYYNASITSWNELMVNEGYKLICCNSNTGANAFFVKKEFQVLFPEVPEDLEDIYVEPTYFLPQRFAHPIALQTLEQCLGIDE